MLAVLDFIFPLCMHSSVLKKFTNNTLCFNIFYKYCFDDSVDNQNL